MLGQSPAEISGVALEAKQNRRAVQIQVAIDNLNRSRAVLARRVLKLIQEYYDNPRVFFMTEGNEDPQAVEVNKRLPDGSTLYDITVGDYDVDVTSQPSRDVYNDQQFAEAMALRAANVMIPDANVIEYSHLEDKRKIAQEVRQLPGTAELTPEQQQMQAAMREIELRQVELQLQQMQAQVENLQSVTALNMAKAKTELSTDETAAMEEFKVQADQLMNIQDNLTKLKVAQINAQSAMDEKVLERATRVDTALIRNAGERDSTQKKLQVEMEKLKKAGANS